MAHPEIGWHELKRRLRRLVAVGRRSASPELPTTISVTVPVVGEVDALAFFESGRAERFFWRGREGRTLAGLGSTARLTGRGPDRFKEARAAWHKLCRRVLVDGPEEIPLALPVCFAGFAFDSGQHINQWQDFPDGLIILPRYVLNLEEDASWLTANVNIYPSSDPEAEAERVFVDLQEILAEGSSVDSIRPCWGGVTVEADTGRFETIIACAVQEIRSSALRKVVLAREVTAHAESPIEPAVVLANLLRDFPDCTTFAFQPGKSCFLGATPELLVRRRGQLAEVDCIAGSTRRGGDETEDVWLADALAVDAKEREEHDLVLTAVRDTLAPLCNSISSPAEPAVMKMSNIQHLYTPVVGELTRDTGVLTLTDLLHPTPAVGGVPRDASLERIRAHEPFDRGWYAGPIGWLDAREDGDFAVAIRSALICGERAFLHAGCGIVAESDVERELAESVLKLQPILRILQGSTSKR